METLKVKPENSGARVVGLIFVPLGALMALLGMVLGLLADPIMMLPFGGVGVLFLLMGILFLAISGRKVRKQQQAVDRGDFIWGTVQAFQADTSVYVNGRSPIRALAEVRGSDGQVHVYRSNANWKVQPLEDLIGTQVKIYGPDLPVPYVDVSSLEKNVVRHF